MPTGTYTLYAIVVFPGNSASPDNTYMSQTFYILTSASIGGTVVPVDKLALLGSLVVPYVPYAGLASVTIIALIITLGALAKIEF
jgi:hypothetical protein